MFNEAWYPENHIGSSSILFRYTVDLTLEGTGEYGCVLSQKK